MSPLAEEILSTTIKTLIPMVIGGGATWIKLELDKKKKAHDKWEESLNGISNDIAGLRTEVKDTNRRIDENQMRISRYRIIRFDDELTRGIYHSDDHCDQILEDIDIYDEYCKQHPEFKNHKGQGAMGRILAADQNGTLRYNPNNI